MSEETETQEEEQVMEQGEGELEEDQDFPFAMARVDRAIRAGLDERKMIRSEVTEAVNLFLGDVALDLATEMNNSQKVMISMFDFQRATNKYERVKKLEVEKERLLTSLRKLELDIQTLREDLTHRL